jgi:hypothetical protein
MATLGESVNWPSRVQVTTLKGEVLVVYEVIKQMSWINESIALYSAHEKALEKANELMKFYEFTDLKFVKNKDRADSWSLPRFMSLYVLERTIE